MSTHADPVDSQSSKFPWYLLWVLAAVALAVTNIAEFLATGRLSALVLFLAWLLWAFSWYAKPFHISFREKWSKAVISGNLRSWVAPRLWNFATFGAFALIFIGVVLRFTNAA